MARKGHLHASNAVLAIGLVITMLFVLYLALGQVQQKTGFGTSAAVSGTSGDCKTIAQVPYVGKESTTLYGIVNIVCKNYKSKISGEAYLYIKDYYGPGKDHKITQATSSCSVCKNLTIISKQDPPYKGTWTYGTLGSGQVTKGKKIDELPGFMSDTTFTHTYPVVMP